MKYRVLLICFLVFLFYVPATGAEESSHIKDDFLWIEYGDGTKEKDGSLILELKVHHGRFPYKRNNSVKLNNLKAFYTVYENRYGNESDTLYHAYIDEDVHGYSIKIESSKQARFVLIVTAEKIKEGISTHYLAKASFTLFGKSMSDGSERVPLSYESINRSLEIHIDPEHNYWPQTGSPVKVFPLFNGKMLPEKSLSVFDEHASPLELNTDNTGNLVYVPHEDRILNSMGETASKQTVLVSSMSDNGIKYISSYTLLLHRSRFGKNKHTPGLIVFGSAFMLFLVYMIVVRMRSRI